MTNPQTSSNPTPLEATTEVSLLDQIIEDGRVGGRDAAAKERGKDMVKQFVFAQIIDQVAALFFFP